MTHLSRAIAAFAVAGWAGLGAASSAAELAPSIPAPSRVVLPCSADPGAACWDHIRPLQRFAAAPGLHLAPVSASVRLAWDSEGVLVRVDHLPEGAHLEVGLAVKPGADRIERIDPFQLDHAGVERLVPTIPIEAGQVRRAWVNVVVSDGDGAAALPWSPAGPATPDHPARLLFAEHPSPGLPVELATGPGPWRWSAVGGAEVRLAHLRPDIPSTSRGVPDPWSLSGDAVVTGDAPADTGWVEAVAVWRDADGRAVDLVSRRVWSEAAGPEGVGPDSLYFPPPKRLTLTGGTFSLPPAPTICAPPALDATADLLARELLRMTAVRALRGSEDCTVFLSIDPNLPQHGFAHQVQRKTIHLTAADPLGLTVGVVSLVDALGPDATMPVLTMSDWPTISTRPLYHSLNLPNRPDLTLDDYVRFIERVVTRGRYSQLHLFLTDGLASPSHPELARPNAWTAADIARIKAVCDGLGIELIPGVNAPAHAAWMLRSHPELSEDVHTSMLDVRHPETRALLSDYYTDVWTAFGKPDKLHIGHDEVLWQSHRWFGDERNPRSSASPRALLFADDLRWHLDWCEARGIQPYMWSDMLLEGWNGRRDGVHEALSFLTPDQRSALQVMAWSHLGDPLEHLTDLWGIDVLRVHTAYVDWKRAGLAASADRIAGEGLALFIPAPWASFAPGTGTRALHFHLGSIVLAGATAWEPTLESAAHIEPTLAALHGHPTLRPGFEAIPFRRTKPLLVAGQRPDRTLPTVAWPESLTSDAIRYVTDPHVSTVDSPVRWTVPATRAAGVSILVAADPTHAAQRALRHTVNRHADSEQQAVGWLVARHADGTETRRPLEYGEDLYALAVDARAVSQWRSADVLALASPEVAHVEPRGRDRRLYRVDLALPTDAAPVTEVRLEATKEGIPLVVAAGVLLRP